MKVPDLSVVVPCYNEEKNLPLLVDRFDKIRPKDISVELVLVDNGSTDGSAALMRKLAKAFPSITITKVKKNVGYGFGIWTGLKKGKGEVLCWTHADLQTDLGDTIRAYKILKKRNDWKRSFIKGRRKGRPFFDTFFTLGMSVFESIILWTPLADINAQPNLFHSSFLEKVGDLPKDFSFDLYFYFMAKRLGYEVVRFPVLFTKRIHGESHWNTSLGAKWKFIKRTVDFTVKLRKHIKRGG